MEETTSLKMSSINNIHIILTSLQSVCNTTKHHINPLIIFMNTHCIPVQKNCATFKIKFIQIIIKEMHFTKTI